MAKVICPFVPAARIVFVDVDKSTRSAPTPR